MKLILAGSFHQAASFARHRGLPRSEWRYLSSERDLYGSRGAEISVVGTAHARSDYVELLELARHHDAKLTREQW